MSKWMSTATIAVIIMAGMMFSGTFVYGTTVLHSFLSVEGLLIVVGGSIANALLSYEREDVVKAFDTIRHMLKKPALNRDKLHKDIMQLIMWSYVVQAQDLLGLEKESTNKIRDPLMRYGIDLVITGYSANNIREMMHTVSQAEFERRTVPVTVLRNMAATAPAFGMVGTLIGMVTILHNVGADVSGIGGGLALAMLATLYGILVARLICLPAADKLLLQEERNDFHNHMIAEGLAMLAEKKKPFYMQDRLNSFLEPSQHIDFDNYVHLESRRHVAMAA